MYLAIQALTAEDFRRLLAEDGAWKKFATQFQDAGYWAFRDLGPALIARWLTVEPGSIVTWAPRLLDETPADDFRLFIIAALAARRPEELLAIVPTRKDAAAREQIIATALGELAKLDLPKARAWLDRCTDPADRKAAEKAVLIGAVQADPLRAIEVAGAMKNRREAFDVLRSAAQSAQAMGPGVLRQLATSPMPPWMVSSLLNVLVNEGRDSELAVDLALQSTNDPNASSMLRSAFTSLARRDPAQAIARMEGLSEKQRATTVAAIGYEWVGSDPVAALAWLAERPLAERNDPNGWPSHDPLVMAFANWVEGAAGPARAWADALPPGELRDSMQKQLAWSLAQQGKAAEAARVLEQMGRAADPKTISIIAQKWASRDPQAAADWAIKQPPGAAQSGALASVVAAWANDDPQGVGNWLSQFPAGESRDRSVVAFLSRDNTFVVGSEARIAEFDAWFDLIDDPWQRAQAAVRIFDSRKELDPSEARKWLASLPNVDPDVIQMKLRHGGH